MTSSATRRPLALPEAQTVQEFLASLKTPATQPAAPSTLETDASARLTKRERQVADLIGEQLARDGLVVAAVHHALPLPAGAVVPLELGVA